MNMVSMCVWLSDEVCARPGGVHTCRCWKDEANQVLVDSDALSAATRSRHAPARLRPYDPLVCDGFALSPRVPIQNCHATLAGQDLGNDLGVLFLILSADAMAFIASMNSATSIDPLP
eukprot:CAMPEP_0174700850 /NCGR_PEP_ID=MMETSP1094-20130205/5679_1 /TAXON_ID=156173 /ORGANISM="Chrysochromulina brevifilum, Strain UTEX LB 985" /LENGTH=117 /DNA_ID=CAMNT_0015898405 /DNA_START=19 /DNA_END=370 /DNA_ORIENTATION=+